MKRIFFLLALALHTPGGAFSADSAFSKDANHVYLCPSDDRPGLIDVDLQKKTCRFIDLKDNVSKGINGLAVSNAGFVLCAEGKSLWAFDPSKSRCVKVCDSPGGEINGIAYDPKSGLVLASAANGLYALPKNGDRLQSVFNRRAGGVAYPTFSSDGELFFAAHGDLWVGDVEPEEKGSELARYGTLVGDRFAPIAVLETSQSNSSSTGVHDIAVSTTAVYARFSRMGGSGWGSFIRIKRPPSISADQAAKDGFPGSEDYWSRAKAALASVESLADCSSVSYLCASRDGRQVFFVNRESGGQSKVYLVQNDGKPALVEIAGLADALGWH